MADFSTGGRGKSDAISFFLPETEKATFFAKNMIENVKFQNPGGQCPPAPTSDAHDATFSALQLKQAQPTRKATFLKRCLTCASSVSPSQCCSSLLETSRGERPTRRI